MNCSCPEKIVAASLVQSLPIEFQLMFHIIIFTLLICLNIFYICRKLRKKNLDRGVPNRLTMSNNLRSPGSVRLKTPDSGMDCLDADSVQQILTSMILMLNTTEPQK